MVTWMGLEAPIVCALQQDFDRAVEAEPLLRDVVGALRNGKREFGVLGGWVRDHLLSKHGDASTALLPRDIDLVVADTTHDTLAQVLPAPTARTVFGGFTFAGTHISIDLWAANDTFLTTRLGLPCDLPHVLAVTDFNVNAIVFLPSQGWPQSALIDGGALDSLKNRTISFHFEFIALPVAQSARLLTFSLKLGFALDAATRRFIRQHCGDDAARSAIRTNLEKHYQQSKVAAAMKLLDSVLAEDDRAQ